MDCSIGTPHGQGARAAGRAAIASGGGDRAGGIHGGLEESGRLRRERGSVRSWLMGMVHHRAVDLVRREEAHRRRAEAAHPRGDRGAGGSRRRGRRAAGSCPRSAGLVRAALAELPGRTAEVLERCTSTGCRSRQIAEKTGTAARHREVPDDARHAPACATFSRRSNDDARPPGSRSSWRSTPSAGSTATTWRCSSASARRTGDCDECGPLEKGFAETAGRGWRSP